MVGVTEMKQKRWSNTARTAKMSHQKPAVCVLDASTYVGFWILKGLLSRGYTVHAAVQKNGETRMYILIFIIFCYLDMLRIPNQI